jgi:hypothetical protein
VRFEAADGSRVEYGLEGTTIRRVQLVGGRVVAREEYPFRAGFDLDAAVEKERLVTLTITSRGREESEAEAESQRAIDNARVDLQVVAALGQGGAK